jgi:phosphatidyl-myo-inositol alpha-mannosyltransferase
MARIVRSSASARSIRDVASSPGRSALLEHGPLTDVCTRVPGEPHMSDRSEERTRTPRSWLSRGNTPPAASRREATWPHVGSGAPARRLAMVTEFYYPHLGGVCEHVHFLSSELRRRGWVVDIITGGMMDAEDPPGVIRLGRSVSVYANGSHARVTLARRLREELRNVLQEGRYDLVHVHVPLAPSLPILALEEASCPVVGTFHTPLGRHLAYELGRGYFQGLMERLSASIAVSPQAAEGFDRYFETSWDIIPNGVDVEHFHPNVPRPEVLADGVPTVLFLGRLDPRNELGTTLKAFSRLRAETPSPLRLLVVGGGPLQRYYEFRARKDDGVRFMGPLLEGRPGYYAHSDVYVYPTTRGTFGITLLEAMACGTPVVCGDIPAFRNVLREGKEGFFVPLRDPVALADKVRVLLCDPLLRQRMGEAGRARALEFSWPRVTDQVQELYERVLGVRTR